MLDIKIKEKVDKNIIIAAIIGLVIIEVTALLNGINGTLLRWVTILIAGLAGLVLPSPKILKR